MAANRITVRLPKEVQDAVGDAIEKKKFKTQTELVVAAIKMFLKIKK